MYLFMPVAQLRLRKEITAQLEIDEATLQAYNKKRYGESYNQYAQILPESCYTIDNWEVKLYPNEGSTIYIVSNSSRRESFRTRRYLFFCH